MGPFASWAHGCIRDSCTGELTTTTCCIKCTVLSKACSMCLLGEACLVNITVSQFNQGHCRIQAVKMSSYWCSLGCTFTWKGLQPFLCPTVPSEQLRKADFMYNWYSLCKMQSTKIYKGSYIKSMLCPERSLRFSPSQAMCVPHSS